MFHYERESRTPSSEAYLIENEQGARARADLHYTPSIVYATVCVPADWSEDDIQDVVSDLDDRIVRSANPFREDFVVTVWSGGEAGVYSDEESVGDFTAGESTDPAQPALSVADPARGSNAAN
ncbi:MAG TPA: hypothetical protein QGF05_00325 [Dehalococcoidia bacterium]|nr:hypothetical protein [Dehalococcoidia bacterium]